MEMVLFFILAVMAVGTGVGVVAQRNVTKSALFLLLNFCCLAGLYILLNAQFVALIQVIVYAGAVVVLFLFVVMLLGIDRIVEVPDSRRYQWIAAVLLGALLLAGVVWAVVETGTGAMPELVRSDNVREIGTALLTDYMIPFELVSLVLLVAVIGALVLAKKRLER